MLGERSLTKALARIARMSPSEIRVRALQEIWKRVDLARANHGRTVGKNKISFSRGARFFFCAADVPAIADALHLNLPVETKATIVEAEKILSHRFDLLGYQDLDYGQHVDWHHDPVHHKSAPLDPWFQVPYLDFDKVGDHKIIWELNRHQHLVTLAKAYRLTGEARFAIELFDQWYDWQVKNPYPFGINWASSLEIAFRSISWIWVRHLLKGALVVPVGFESDLAQALALNARHMERHLSTYFAPNTHLLGEAVALLFIGTLLSESRQAKRWKQLGWKLIQQQAEKQVLPDGMHFEQSTYYHVYALDFLLHARIFAARNGFDIPPGFDATLERMLQALDTLCATGVPVSFGDDDGGRVFNPRRNRREHLADPLCLGAILFRRGAWKIPNLFLCEEACWLLGPQAANIFDSLPGPESSQRSNLLVSAGLCILSSQTNRSQILLDAGPQGSGWGGHGHADALAVQLSVDGNPVLIDAGTASYTEPSRSPFRATSSHNSIEVDHLDQAQSDGPFKWVHLANAQLEKFIVGENGAFCAASHGGYSRLKSKLIHRREIYSHNGELWLIRDRLFGSGTHHISLGWHFAPGRSLSSHGKIITYGGSAPGAVDMSFCCPQTLQPAIGDGLYSSRYGSVELAPVCRISGDVQLPVDVTSVFARVSIGVEQFTASSGAQFQAYTLKVSSGINEFYFAEHELSPSKPNVAWRSAEVQSDSSFFHRQICGSTNAERYFLSEASFLEVAGRRLFSLPESVTLYEAATTSASQLAEFSAA